MFLIKFLMRITLIKVAKIICKKMSNVYIYCFDLNLVHFGAFFRVRSSGENALFVLKQSFHQT